MGVHVVQHHWPPPQTLGFRDLDLPQATAGLQWWYFHGHLSAGGREFSLFASFFRAVTGRHEADGAPRHGHALTWALTDLGLGIYHKDSRVDPDAPAIGLKNLLAKELAYDDWIDRAVVEVLRRGVVPLPDRPFAGPVMVSELELDLGYGDCRLSWESDGGYRLELGDASGGYGCDLVFRPTKEPVRHGGDGLIRGLGSGETFYFSIPRCLVEGTLRAGGETLTVERGQGWYDREFTGSVGEGSPAALREPAAARREPAQERAEDLAWSWLAVQLDDGTDLCAYEAFSLTTGARVEKQLLIVSADGTHGKSQDFDLTCGEPWCSSRTFQEYPMRYGLRTARLGLDLVVEATVPDQEFMTVIARPAFWEGSCRVRGTAFGRPVSGRAFVERTGFGVIDDLTSLSTAVGQAVRSALDRVVPRDPGYEQMRLLIAAKSRDRLMDGVDLPTLTANLITPMREIADRGGKAWRSYAALVCCDAVGGDSRDYVDWLAAPELLHVGSMMVDDVQDRSAVRRGGPAAHVLHGEARAINAGTAAYFLAERILADNDLTKEQQLRLYELYFLALRAGHAGQALDLAGLGDQMPEVVATGEAGALTRRVLAAYRLKTAAPVSCLAAMGALAGGANDEQIAALSTYLEAMALGFQVRDDVLNLTGFEGDRKSRGEDVRNGLVTLPVAYAMGRLPLRRRQWLWRTLSACPQDEPTVAQVTAVIESCGALAACGEYASSLVEDGWREVESVLEPSFYSVMLRALGWFAVERRH